MKPATKNPTVEWSSKWIAAVVNGDATMSSRKLTSIEKRSGGLKAVAAIARKPKVHLLLLANDQGEKIVAASKQPFKIIT
jgi:hypothetical protein